MPGILINLMSVRRACVCHHHQQVLQVGVGATEKEIKKAYRKMCLLWVSVLHGNVLAVSPCMYLVCVRRHWCVHLHTRA